jgi:membrane fusion protein (multidrug efflux system)
MTNGMMDMSETTQRYRRPLIWGGTILVIVAATLAFRSFGRAGAAGAGAGAAGGPPGGMPPMPVDVDTARSGKVIDAVRATGKIEAVQSIELKADGSGRVTALLFREGQRVAAGTPLIQLDDEMLRAEVAKAQADYDLAKQKLARAERLRTENANSAQDYDEAAAGARAAEATLASLQVQLQHATIRAPFGGVVGQRFISKGDYVTPASPLLSLQTTDPQRVVIDIPERHAAQLRPGQNVDFTVAAQPDRTFHATVEFVDPVVEETGRTILVKARAANPSGFLKAGMFVEARLATGTRTGAIVVPEDAIQPLRTSNVVWAIVDGKATRRTVQLGARTAGVVEVLSGVKAGEQVVVGGLERMQEGMAVAARQRGAAAAAQRAGDQKPADAKP